ncbi:MAG: aspartate aminotransferase [Acidobacteriaceae bacterium]|jgi:aspartate aminotransferase
MLLAERTKKLTPPGTSKMRELANELKKSGVDVVNFAAGELDGDASDLIKHAAKNAIDGGCNKYTPTLGMKKLRERIAARVSDHTGVRYSANEIAVTAGAKQALYNAAMVLFNPGDEVVIPKPYWVTFPTQIEMAGAKTVFVDTAQSNYQLKADDVENIVSPTTRGLIINSPNNPTGAVYKSEDLLRIAQLALKRNLWIIFDECYSELVRVGAVHRNVVQLLPQIKEQTVLVNSFSKSYAITGWRLGYACGPANIITAMENIQGHTTSNPCSISQYAAEAALRGDDGLFINNVNAVLEERLGRARRIVSTMKDISCAPAEGAFYLFLNIQTKLGKTYDGRVINDVDSLCELILKEANVAVVSGAAFGDPTGIRVSYAIETQQVEEGLSRMRRFFERII